MIDLPLIRHSERVDFKRCPKKWYWHWRLGLFPKAQDYGALTLGTWVHAALADWYSGDRAKRVLADSFRAISGEALLKAQHARIPAHLLEQAEEAAALGEAMTIAYQKKWGADPTVRVIAAEIPLEFPIKDYNGRVVAIHKLKPDLVFEDLETGEIWLMEHKTAKQIRLGHLPIDDQARPYAAMAELAMRRKGILKPHQHFKGVRYNFLRKALPDEREMNAQGLYLNKNGTVSKRQPTPVFVRHPIVLTSKAKKIALMRLGIETRLVTEFASEVRAGQIDPMTIPKTPHSSCEKLCQYFAMCVVEEQGGDIATMRRTMYHKENPYTYLEDTTDIPLSFELS
jgi:hypothetical protein